MMVAKVFADGLRDLVRLERPVAGNGFADAGSGTWALVCEVWAEIEDVLPSHGEQLTDGFNMAARPATVRIRWRSGITPEMRFVLGSRVMQIVSGPAEIGRREGLEFMVKDYRPAGNPA